jgi:CRISPR/Cas system-associated exonuclease Cas4 (RecB family)
MPFPAVFSALNTRLQGTLVGKDLQELSPLLPKGLVESQEGFVESKIIPGTNIYIKGKYDLLVLQPDGNYLIVDFKISQPHEDKIAKYQTQLQSYQYTFEYPAKGEAKRITKLGLIVMYPDRVKFARGEAFLSFPPKWLEINIERDNFLNFIKGINDLLEGPVPPENPDCKWCEYRHFGEKYAHLFTK